MANKLYEESAVQDIADAIREKTGVDDTYTVSQMGEAVRGISVGVDTSDATATAEDILYGKSAYVGGERIEGARRSRRYSGEIVSTILGMDAYAVLAQDAFLAQHRNDDSLFVRVEFDVEQVAYTIVKSWATNTTEILPYNGSETYQMTQRWGADAELNCSSRATPINSDAREGVATVFITESGELCIMSGSTNYAIRPSNYTVDVEW